MNGMPSSPPCSSRQASYKARFAALEENPAFEETFLAFESALRDIARSHRRRERYCTLATADIVGVAYMRLRGNVPANFDDNIEFKRAATVIVQRILTDAARRRKSQKRGGGQIPETLHDFHEVSVPRDETLLDLDRYLDELAEVDPVMAEAIDMKFYGGCTVEEIAEHQSASLSTIARRLRQGLRWLRSKIELQPPPALKKAA